MAKTRKLRTKKNRIQVVSDNAKIRPLTAREKRLQKIFGAFK